MDSETFKTAVEITQVMDQLKRLNRKRDAVNSAISFLEDIGIIVDTNSQKYLTGIYLFGGKYTLA